MDLKLFLTAFMQVFLVSANTLFITKMFYPGIALAGYSISWFWSGNVKKVSFGNKKHRYIYSFGAMCGGLFGVFINRSNAKVLYDYMHKKQRKLEIIARRNFVTSDGVFRYLSDRAIFFTALQANYYSPGVIDGWMKQIQLPPWK